MRYVPRFSLELHIRKLNYINVFIFYIQNKLFGFSFFHDREQFSGSAFTAQLIYLVYYYLFGAQKEKYGNECERHILRLEQSHHNC